jgi:hypothetical protein
MSEQALHLVPPPGAARILNVKTQTLAKWRWEGRGPRFIRLSSRRVVYDMRDLREWVDSRRQQSTSEG